MAHHAAADQSAEFKTYTAIWIALMVLTVITVALSFVDFGSHSTNLIIAMAVATVKAALVALYFMHLKHEGGWIWTYALYPLVLIAMLMGACVAEDLIRQDTFLPHPQKDKNWGMEGHAAPAGHAE